jgi:hypothetical protein
MDPTAFNRFIAGVVGAAVGGLALYIAGINVAKQAFDDTWIFWVPITLAIGCFAVLCWGFALRGDRPESYATLYAAWRGGLWVGGLSFVAGYAGPLILSQGNLGPLLGILITGPIGFVLGVAGAAAVRKLRAAAP